MAESKVNKLEDVFPLMVACREASRRLDNALNTEIALGTKLSPDLITQKNNLAVCTQELRDFVLRELFDSSSCLLTPLKKSKKE